MNRITFNSFLCGMTSRDYINQDEDYSTQIDTAIAYIKNADYILIGAGAGLSTAAGAQYGGKFFEDHFKEFQEIYGDNPYMHDMYSAGFYPYPDQESYWGYWSKEALLAGVELNVSSLHRSLLDKLKDKQLFVLSTNADKQFSKAGLDEKYIFATQGDYYHIQCAKGCHKRVYDAVDLFYQMDQARRNCKIPKYMVPKCPVCGNRMDMNLRKDNYFVEDENWHLCEQRFSDFLNEAIEKNLVLLELGVGFNTPTIIRFPFEKLVREHKNIKLIRLNLNEAILPREISDKSVGINADIKQSLTDITKGL